MNRNLMLCGLAAMLCGLMGCGPENVIQQPPPPPVTIAQPVVKTVTNFLEETGTTEAVDRVEIRARVQGFLEKIDFEAGADVKAGERLYLIQQREFQAEVAAKQADLKAAQARLERAKLEATRQRNLLAENATAQANVDTAIAEEKSAEADVDIAAAALDQADLNLSYTEVTSPIDGRVGKTLVKLGNLVGSDGDTHLTTVISYDPIYANFNISERALLELTEDEKASKRGPNREKRELDVFLSRANDEGFPFKGQFDYADLAVDQTTGTFLIRAVFPNPDHLILPGLFVRVRVPIGVKENAVLVSERSVSADQAGRYVLIVNSENKVERRDVRPGIKYGGLVVVEGLKPDEWVIVEGIQRARPGAEVTPERTELTLSDETLENVEDSSAGPPPEPVDASDPAPPDEVAPGAATDTPAAPGEDATEAPSADSESSPLETEPNSAAAAPAGDDTAPTADSATP